MAKGNEDTGTEEARESAEKDLGEAFELPVTSTIKLPLSVALLNADGTVLATRLIEDPELVSRSSNYPIPKGDSSGDHPDKTVTYVSSMGHHYEDLWTFNKSGSDGSYHLLRRVIHLIDVESAPVACVKVVPSPASQPPAEESSDAGVNTDLDAGIDAGMNPDLDGGMDAGMNSGADAGTDAGVPAAGYLYVSAAPMSGTGPGSVLQFVVSDAGGLTALSPASVATGEQPAGIAVMPSGSSPRYAYVTNTSSNTVSQYEVGQDGTLTALSPSTVSTGMGPGAIAIAGAYVYVANANGGDVSQFSIGAGGQLTSLGSVAAGSFPSGLCVAGSNVYVSSANPGEGISQFSIQSGGTLAPLTPATAGSGGNLHIGCRPQGPNIYAIGMTTAGGSGFVEQFSIDSTGALSALTPATASTGTSLPGAVVVDPGGTYVFALDFIDQEVALFSVDTGGALAPMTPPALSLVTAESGTFDATGRYFFVLNGSDVASYAVSAGAVTPLAATPVSGVYPLGMTAAAP